MGTFLRGSEFVTINSSYNRLLHIFESFLTKMIFFSSTNHVTPLLPLEKKTNMLLNIVRKKLHATRHIRFVVIYQIVFNCKRSPAVRHDIYQF